MKAMSGQIVRSSDPASSLDFILAEDEHCMAIEREVLREMQKRLREDLGEDEMNLIRDFADACRERRTRFATAIERRRARAEGLVIK